MITKYTITTILTVLIFSSSLVAYQTSNAETPESLLAQFEIVANENIRLQDEQSLKTQELDDAKANKSATVSTLEAELNAINEKIAQNEIKLDEIRAATSKFFEIDSQLKATLDEAQQILTDNHDAVPWNGLGIDYRQKALSVQFEDEKTAEESRPLIKKLVGEDIPIVIAVGQNSWNAGCSSRTVDCSQLIGGLQIDDDTSGSTIECTLGFPVKQVISGTTKYGHITAGHCYALSTSVRQPYGSTSTIIGTVITRDFVNNGDCDCEFIEQSSLDARPDQVYEASNSVYSITSKGTVGVGSYAVVSGAYSNYIDWGIVEGINYSFTASGITITGMTRVSSWTADNGDSGAPVFDPTSTIKKLYGTHSGNILSGTYAGQRVFTPWAAIASNLSVS
ncbi:MAG: hypothetical protein ACREAK_10045 [Nitrosarchaeum sp.]